jgi:serine/arginine repetitive matrix protein 2
MKDGDTMISMSLSSSLCLNLSDMLTDVGGGHVCRHSMEAMPCPRVEKRKLSVFQAPQTHNGFQEYLKSPNKARIIEKLSIALTSSYTFGGE